MEIKKTEDQEHAALFEYASWQKEPEFSLLFSILMGGYRAKKTGARLKRQSAKAGIAENLLISI